MKISVSRIPRSRIAFQNGSQQLNGLSGVYYDHEFSHGLAGPYFNYEFPVGLGERGGIVGPGVGIAEFRLDSYVGTDLVTGKTLTLREVIAEFAAMPRGMPAGFPGAGAPGTLPWIATDPKGELRAFYEWARRTGYVIKKNEGGLFGTIDKVINTAVQAAVIGGVGYGLVSVAGALASGASSTGAAGAAAPAAGTATAGATAPAVVGAGGASVAAPAAALAPGAGLTAAAGMPAYAGQLLAVGKTALVGAGTSLIGAKASDALARMFGVEAPADAASLAPAAASAPATGSGAELLKKFSPWLIGAGILGMGFVILNDGKGRKRKSYKRR